MTLILTLYCIRFKDVQLSDEDGGKESVGISIINFSTTRHLCQILLKENDTKRPKEINEDSKQGKDELM